MKLVDFVRTDCFELPALPPSPPAGTDNISPSRDEPPWPSGTLEVPKPRKPGLAISVFGGIAVGCALLYLSVIRHHDGQGSSLTGQSTPGVSTKARPPVTISESESNAPELGGYVVDEATGQPLERVSLSLLDYNDVHGMAPVCYTDKEGHFRFHNLSTSSEPVQRVRLVARKDGYQVRDSYISLGTTTLPVTLKPVVTPEHDR